MTRKDVNKVLLVLEKIKNPDSYVIEAIHTCKKEIAMFDSRKGQLSGPVEYDYPW